MSDLTISGVSFIKTPEDAELVAGHFARSGYFPDAKSVDQAFVKLVFGAAQGMTPLGSMQGFHIIKGQISLSAGAIASRVQASGTYDFRVREDTDERCRIEFFKGEESLGVSEFTIKDAERAGLLSNPVWKRYPSNMLYNRAMSNGYKRFTPSVFEVSVYTPEELGVEVDGDGDIIDVESVVVVEEKAPVKKVAPVKKTEAKKPVKKEKPESITATQVKQLAALIQPLKLPKQDGFNFIKWVTNTEIETITQLTTQDAEMALAFLTDRGVDQAFKEFLEH